MIRIGVVGVGTYGQNHLAVYKEMEETGRVQLAAFAEMKEELRNRRSEEYGIPAYASHTEMIEKEELDAITVATPDHLHFDIAMDGLNAGKHVLVEKPLDVETERCRTMVAKADEKGLLLAVDFHKRFDPYHIEMRESCLEGKFGDVEYGYAWMEDKLFVPVDMLGEWSGKSSPVWFLGVHIYDLVRWIMGNPDPVRVFATGQKKKLALMQIDTFDSVQAHVTFSNGATVTFHNSWIIPDAYEAVVHQGVKLVGSEGIVECDSQYRGTRGCLKGESMRTWNLGLKYRERDKHNKLRWRGYYHSAIADFVENLWFMEDGGTLAELEGRYPSGTDGLAVTQIACAVHDSIEQGAPIQIQ